VCANGGMLIYLAGQGRTAAVLFLSGAVFMENCSKRWKHHEAMLALYFVWYNFAKKHSMIKTSPAVESGLTDQVWSIEELLMEAAK
jgi:hypothetical protein